jgi:hypothetical protein
MGKKWSEIVSESPAGPLDGSEVVVAVQGAQTVGLDYASLKAWLQFKNNLTATADPGVNDDSAAGYEPGSKWLNTNTDEWFICSLAAAGAAVWEPLSLSADDLGSMAVVDDAVSDGSPYARQDGSWQQLGSASLANVGNAEGDLVERTDVGAELGGGFVEIYKPLIVNDSVFVVETGSNKPSKITVLFHQNAADFLARSVAGNSNLTGVAIYAQSGTEIVAGANGEYTGTTGNDGEFTVAADDAAGANGKFYFESRAGNRNCTIIIWYPS